MVSLILSRAGLSPTFIIGGYAPQLGTNAAAGQSDLFVIEADEYDHTFLSLKPDIAAVTTMEWDHPDIYQTAEAYQQAFVDFLKLVPAQGTIILCGDDPGVQTLLPMFPNALTYGLDGENSWRAVNPTSNNEGGFRFELEIDHQRPLAEPISLKVPGLHNVSNSLAALAMSSSVGVPLAEAAEIIATYTGTERRFVL
jgi:UDP-N-acetylmuramate--alanine ligase